MIKQGDQVLITGDSGFCSSGYREVTKILTRYNEITGKPYKIAEVSDGSGYRVDTGVCVKSPTAYYMVVTG